MMNVATNSDLKPVVIDGAVIGQLEAKNDGFVVKGLKDSFFRDESEATSALVARRERTIQLTEKHRQQHRNVRITIGRTLHDALMSEGLWIGLPVEETKTQTTVEVENTDMVRASLQELISTLESTAKSNTRTERNSMRSRALIGAAKQQLAKL